MDYQAGFLQLLFSLFVPYPSFNRPDRNIPMRWVFRSCILTALFIRFAQVDATFCCCGFSRVRSPCWFPESPAQDDVDAGQHQCEGEDALDKLPAQGSIAARDELGQ